jgi:hypothetical protein
MQNRRNHSKPTKMGPISSKAHAAQNLVQRLALATSTFLTAPLGVFG